MATKKFAGTGIDAGAQTISNLADGVAASDAATVGQLGGGGTGVVRYDAAQSLSVGEQDQAQTNIGLPPIAVDAVLTGSAGIGQTERLIRDEEGVRSWVTEVAPAPTYNMFQKMTPAAGTGTVGVLGCVYGGTGTATAAALASTSRYTSIRRVDMLVTTAAATAVAGIRTSAVSLLRGTASGGGFQARIVAGPATGTTVATDRYFQGFRNVTSAPTDVNPSTLVNMVGIGWDSADTEVQIMCNDASGTATKVSTGWAIPTADRAALYAFDLECVAGGASFSYSVKDVLTGTTLTGTLSTDIPAATVALLPLAYHSVGGTSSVVGLTFVDYEAREQVL